MDYPKKEDKNNKEIQTFSVLIEEIFDQNDVLESLGMSPSSEKEKEKDSNAKLIMQRTFTKYFNAENEHEAKILAKEWCKNQGAKKYTVFNTKKKDKY